MTSESSSRAVPLRAAQIPAAGERRALGGYHPQYRLAASLVLRALRDGALEWLRLADPEAGRLDDVRIGTPGRIDAYQVKWSRDATTFTFNDLVARPDATTPGLIAQLADGWRRLGSMHTGREVVVHLATERLPVNARPHRGRERGQRPDPLRRVPHRVLGADRHLRQRSRARGASRVAFVVGKAPESERPRRAHLPSFRAGVPPRLPHRATGRSSRPGAHPAKRECLARGAGVARRPRHAHPRALRPSHGARPGGGVLTRPPPPGGWVGRPRRVPKPARVPRARHPVSGGLGDRTRPY